MFFSGICLITRVHFFVQCWFYDNVTAASLLLVVAWDLYAHWALAGIRVRFGHYLYNIYLLLIVLMLFSKALADPWTTLKTFASLVTFMQSASIFSVDYVILLLTNNLHSSVQWAGVSDTACNMYAAAQAQSAASPVSFTKGPIHRFHHRICRFCPFRLWNGV